MPPRRASSKAECQVRGRKSISRYWTRARKERKRWGRVGEGGIEEDEGGNGAGGGRGAELEIPSDDTDDRVL